MTHSVSQHLRIDVDQYDATIQRFIPRYAEMVDRATAEVAARRPGRVIDLGAGTGALAASLLGRTDTTVVELWDVDDAMLEVARVRLARFGDRARFVHGSFDDAFPAADAFMASLALHHVRELTAKAALYQRIATALRPGGVLVNADATITSDAPAQAAIWRGWADHMVANGIEERRAWQHFAEWAGEDRYFPLDQELPALRQAGLEPVVAWQAGPLAVTVSTKP